MPIAVLEKFTTRSAVQTAATFLAVVAGSAIVLVALPHTYVPYVARYIYGDRLGVPGVADRLPAALCPDLLVVLGYFLVLGGFACYFRAWAVSETGRLVAGYVIAAVCITAIADLVEDGLLYWSLRYQKSEILINATSATATIKWCALLLALGGIPATVGILFRKAAARSRRRRATSSEATSTDWWNHVLIPTEDTDVRSPGSTEPLVIEDEWSWIKAYSVPGASDVIDKHNDEKVQAICLSGGGVRSACVAMGALQVFSDAPPIKTRPDPEPFGKDADPKLIDTVDYVISVSGGGYTAGARLLAVQPPQDDAGDSEKPLISRRFEDGSVEFDHFRRGSSYIADSPADLIRALAQVLKNLLASMTILFTPPVFMGWLFGYLLARPHFAFAAVVPVPNSDVDQKFRQAHPEYSMCLDSHHASWLAVAFFAFWAVVFTTVAIVIELFGWDQRSERRKLKMQNVAVGSAIFAVLVLTIAVGLPFLMRLCSTLSLHASKNPGGAAATFSGVVGLNYLAAVAAMAWKNRSAVSAGAAKVSSWKRVLPPGIVPMILVALTLAVLLVAWLTTLGVFAAAVFRDVTADGLEGGSRYVPNWWFLVVLACTILWIGAVDVTSVSLHPFYRRRLARTFAVRRRQTAPGGGSLAQRYADIEWTWLPRYGRVPGDRGPRFIFAAAATITGDGKPAPGLNAVSYVLSGDHIGGPELGWFDTTKLFNEAPARLKRDLTVVAAVAVSGAAFASAMGRHQKGFEKLLAVSGARLGTWLPNPNFVAELRDAQDGTGGDAKQNARPWPKLLPTIRGAGYFYRELFGFNYNDARLVQITDGGHYENLGLVEALRRRCRLIFCFDGGGDTPPLLSGLADAMRLAEYELGVTIKFESEEYPLKYLAPSSGQLAEGHPLSKLNKRLTKKTVAVGSITYPAASGLPEDHRDGVLIFAKSVLCQDCPEWLLTYAASNDAFPHDPTSDQWFNEGQFAAYTELGRIMGRQAVECAGKLKRLAI